MSNTVKIVLCGVFTALVTVMTMLVQIPITVSGYVNIGDAFVMLAGVLLGPIFGTVSAGLGSALADIISGYYIFAPGTLIIKAGMALVSYYLYYALMKVIKNKYLPSTIIMSIVTELVMVAGYFLYSCLFMGEGLSAAASIPANLLQGAIAIVAFAVLMSALVPTKLFDKLRNGKALTRYEENAVGTKKADEKDEMPKDQVADAK